jgi:predicted small lipoprotein YifL
MLLVALTLTPLAACGKKGEPEPPSGRKSAPERPYPKPDPVPWQTDEQQKQRKK